MSGYQSTMDVPQWCDTGAIINLTKQGYCIQLVCLCVCLFLCVRSGPVCTCYTIHGILYHEVFMYFLLGSTQLIIYSASGGGGRGEREGEGGEGVGR